MKTQKRNRVDRAYHSGYKAGVRGKSSNLCPFGIPETRGSWMGGWREGRNDLKGGYLDLEDL